MAWDAPQVAFRMKVPEGPTVEMTTCDFTGGVVTVFWLRRPVVVVVVMESDLFKQCERLASGVSRRV